MDREALKELLPHRGRMLLLDTAEKNGDAAIASYTVRGNEWFLDGHFPDNPIVPGVVLLEMLAQSACVLLKDYSVGKLPLYAGIQNARFKHPLRPGDTLQMETRITHAKPPFFFAKGVGFVEDSLCVQAEFCFALKDQPD